MAYVIFFHRISAVFSIYCYHGLSSVVQSSSFIFSILPWGFWDQFKKKFFVQKCTFGGWIWPATLLKWFCDSYFLPFHFLYFFYNSLFPGNCRAGWTIYTEKCSYLFRIDSIWFNRFHHFSIGFTQLSNLFQPFAVGSNQCLAYFMVLSLDFSSCSIYWIFCTILPWFSSVVKSISSF